MPKIKDVYESLTGEEKKEVYEKFLRKTGKSTPTFYWKMRMDKYSKQEKILMAKLLKIKLNVLFPTNK